MCRAWVPVSLQRQAARTQTDTNAENIETDWSSGGQQQWISIYSPNKPRGWGWADAVCGTSTCMCAILINSPDPRCWQVASICLTVGPPGCHVSARVCLPVLLTVSNITLWCVLWGNPAWGFGITITFHVSVEMLGCTSCRACCLLGFVRFWVFFFFLFHDRHVVLHFQPQTATAGVGPQGQMLHIHHGWHNSCQQTKYSRNKSAVAALGNRMVVGCPQAKTVGEILDSLKSIFCFLSYVG